MIDRKGFVELELNTPSNSSIGNATLALHYAAGGRGEYKLNIVQNSRVDRVERTTVGASAERFTLTGNNLNKLRNSFSATGPSNSISLTRVSESDSTLVLDRNGRNCSARTFELDLKLEQADACVIKNVKLPMTRDATCDGNTPPPPPPLPVPAPQPPAPQPPAPPRVQQPNLLPSLATPTVLTRPLGAVVVTTRGGMFPVNSFFCGGLAVNTPTTVNVPKLTWVSSASISKPLQAPMGASTCN